MFIQILTLAFILNLYLKTLLLFCSKKTENAEGIAIADIAAESGFFISISMHTTNKSILLFHSHFLLLDYLHSIHLLHTGITSLILICLPLIYNEVFHGNGVRLISSKFKSIQHKCLFLA